MATLPTTEPAQVPSAASGPGGPATVAFCLPSMPAESLHAIVSELQEAFEGQSLLIASPDQAEEAADGSVRLVPYPVQRSDSDWVLRAADYTAASRLAQQRNLQRVVLLGAEASSLRVDSMLALRDALAGSSDLVVPQYHIGPQQGLVNTALLYPISRALFGVDVRFPLPLDVALSQRMLRRLETPASRAGNDGGLVWPVAEAALAGFSIQQVGSVTRTLPRPQESDLNVLFPAVTSSLFADMEAKAAYWQRARAQVGAQGSPISSELGEVSDPEEIRSLVEGFRLAFSNLREIWALVLPPHSLLALKRLSQSSPESFSFPQSLWARVVYDFALAFHMRTINRGHLLGAMTPLYLAWVASLLRESGGPGAQEMAAATARAFEMEKPYLVSRWRWPDRFNP